MDEGFGRLAIVILNMLKRRQEWTERKLDTPHMHHITIASSLSKAQGVLSSGFSDSAAASDGNASPILILQRYLNSLRDVLELLPVPTPYDVTSDNGGIDDGKIRSIFDWITNSDESYDYSDPVFGG